MILLIVAFLAMYGCSKREASPSDSEAGQLVFEETQSVNTQVEQPEEVQSEEDQELNDAEKNDNAEENDKDVKPSKPLPALSESQKKALEAQEILKAHRNKNLMYSPLQDPEEEYNLNIVKNIHMIAIETGEYSINQTKTNYKIGGTDLGISFNLEDKTYIAFGDTFAEECFTNGWRSNVLAVTTDRDYTDGITFDSMISKPGLKSAKELIKSKKIDNVEMTTIPTGGIAIGKTLYMSYMSVRHWGAPGEWDCNYGSVAKSVDNGENWEPIETLRWPGDSSFCQMAPVVIEDYVYILGITGGRQGAAKMMRVPIDEYENFEAYEYLVGIDEEGEPLYKTGEAAMYETYSVLPKAVGELSVLYSDYLQEWLVTYISGTGNIVMRSAKNIYGPYSKPVTLAAQKDFPSLYGAFMNPEWVSEDGTKIAFMMSIYDPVYNVILMECELEK
ncbi:MAG: carbohydrate-binding protein [Herbinix sp.]|jgi:hypothetical protein|nr:carbohydrate-binding protein [Herbinix sp.]